MARDILLIGTGNVATHLAKALSSRIMAVISRDVKHAKALAAANSIPACGSISNASAYNPQFVIISVADNAVPELVKTIGKMPGEPLVVHTSGTLPKEILLPMSPRTGVLYPLMTFSKLKAVAMSTVPFFTETALESDRVILDTYARLLSSKIQHADIDQRKQLHIAGVLSCNFTVALLEMTDELLKDNGYTLDTVRPLVMETVDKAFTMGPHMAMTGPAKRGDKDVIRQQEESLDLDLQPIYEILTDYIIRKHRVELK